jgi:hypothetical protein
MGLASVLLRSIGVAQSTPGGGSMFHQELDLVSIDICAFLVRRVYSTNDLIASFENKQFLQMIVIVSNDLELVHNDDEPGPCLHY